MDKKGVLYAWVHIGMWGFFHLLETTRDRFLPPIDRAPHWLVFYSALSRILLIAEWGAFRSVALETKDTSDLLVAGVLISVNWFTYVWRYTWLRS